YPRRLPSAARRASPDEWGELAFAPLEPGAYPAYDAVRAAAAAGGNRGAILNAADEVGVAAFLAGRLRFTDIGSTIAEAVARWGEDADPSLDEVVALDAEVRADLSASLGLPA
ncbi:MAG: 1-deoxy-D-xylulose-5-phosphate reductoisomerase, partial [Candidatus Limnocylindria bacterium]